MILELIVLMNLVRTTPLVENPVLSERAEVRAEHLCEVGQWSHDGWKGSFDGFGPYIGENLAKNFKSASKMHAALMQSPTHRKNILNPKYKQVGIGKACGITVELFAS